MTSTERDARSSIRARHAAARVAPDEGTWQAPYREPRGSAPRERDHRGGDHPVPSRTRQLSPPSPRVLQREAAGGQGVALAEGAFLYARVPRAPRAPHAPGGARGGGSLAGLSASRASERPVKEIVFLQVLSAFRAPTPWMTASLISAVAGFLLAMMSLD